MLIERQLSWALAGVSLALARAPVPVPHGTLLVALALGALGVFLGATLALDAERLKVVRLVPWALVALALSAASALAAWRSGGWAWPAGHGAAALLPLAALLLPFRRTG